MASEKCGLLSSTRREFYGLLGDSEDALHARLHNYDQLLVRLSSRLLGQYKVVEVFVYLLDLSSGGNAIGSETLAIRHISSRTLL